jgi:hypothetical protein
LHSSNNPGKTFNKRIIRAAPYNSVLEGSAAPGEISKGFQTGPSADRARQNHARVSRERMTLVSLSKRVVCAPVRNRPTKERGKTDTSSVRLARMERVAMRQSPDSVRARRRASAVAACRSTAAVAPVAAAPGRQPTERRNARARARAALSGKFVSRNSRRRLRSMTASEINGS